MLNENGEILKYIPDTQLRLLWEEADNNVSTDRTHSGIPKGDIWEELSRRDEEQRALYPGMVYMTGFLEMINEPEDAKNPHAEGRKTG